MIRCINQTYLAVCSRGLLLGCLCTDIWSPYTTPCIYTESDSSLTQYIAHHSSE